MLHLLFSDKVDEYKSTAHVVLWRNAGSCQELDAVGTDDPRRGLYCFCFVLQTDHCLWLYFADLPIFEKLLPEMKLMPMDSANICAIGPELAMLITHRSALLMLHGSEMARRSGCIFQSVSQSVTKYDLLCPV